MTSPYEGDHMKARSTREGHGREHLVRTKSALCPAAWWSKQRAPSWRTEILDQSCGQQDCVSAFHRDSGAPLHDELVTDGMRSPLNLLLAGTDADCLDAYFFSLADCLTFLSHHVSWSFVQKRIEKHLFRLRRESWKWIWTRLCRAQENTKPDQLTGNWSEASCIQQDSKNEVLMEAHESTRQQVEPSVPKIHEDHIAGKAQVYVYASSNEKSGCKGSSGQGMEEARNDSSMAAGWSQGQKKCYSGGTKRQK